MPDNWGYVFGAYGIAAIVLVAYWRRLERLGQELFRSDRRGERGKS